MSFEGIRNPVSPEDASTKAAKDGSDFTNPDTWAAKLDSQIRARALDHDQTRAPRPGVWSDGGTPNRGVRFELGALGNVAGSALALGGWVRVPSSPPATSAFFFAFASNLGLDPNTIANVATGRITSTGGLRVQSTGSTVANYRYFDYPDFLTDYAGRLIFLEIDFSEGDSTTPPTIRVDRVDVSSRFTETPGGTPPNWMPLTLDATYLGTYNWPAGEQPLFAVLNVGGQLARDAFGDLYERGLLPSWCNGTASMVAKKSVAALAVTSNDFSGFWRRGRKYAAIVTSIVPDGGIFAIASTSDGAWLSTGITAPGTYIFESNSTSIQFRWNSAGASSSIDFHIIELGLLVDPIPQSGSVYLGDGLERCSAQIVGGKSVGGTKPPHRQHKIITNSTGSAQPIAWTACQPPGTRLTMVRNRTGAAVNKVGTTSGGTELCGSPIASGAAAFGTAINAANAFSDVERTLHFEAADGANGTLTAVFE